MNLFSDHLRNNLNRGMALVSGFREQSATAAAQWQTQSDAWVKLGREQATQWTNTLYENVDKMTNRGLELSDAIARYYNENGELHSLSATAFNKQAITSAQRYWDVMGNAAWSKPLQDAFLTTIKAYTGSVSSENAPESRPQ